MNTKTNLQPMYVIREANAILHLSKGNSKIGKTIWAFSTLPGNKKNLLMLQHSILLTDIPGTCSKYCKGCFNGGCYAVASGLLHHNVTIKAWGDNTLLLRAGKVFTMIDDYITTKNQKYYQSHKQEDLRIAYFRVNVSGEIQNLAEFEAWNQLAIKHPEVKFGVYTKNFDDLGKFLDKYGTSAPNFCINISQWNHVADDFIKKYKYAGLNIFEYDETNRQKCDWSEEDRKRLAKITHCPAVDEKGHHKTIRIKVKGEWKDVPMTCDRCKRCYRKTGDETAVYSH